jgi:hypothetical protein
MGSFLPNNVKKDPGPFSRNNSRSRQRSSDMNVKEKNSSWFHLHVFWECIHVLSICVHMFVHVYFLLTMFTMLIFSNFQYISNMVWVVQKSFNSLAKNSCHFFRVKVRLAFSAGFFPFIMNVIIYCQRPLCSRRHPIIPDWLCHLMPQETHSEWGPMGKEIEGNNDNIINRSIQNRWLLTTPSSYWVRSCEFSSLKKELCFSFGAVL